VITAGWAFGVIFGVLTAKAFGSSDAHLNPAVSLAFAILNRNFSNLPIFILAQVLGAFFRWSFSLLTLFTSLERS